MATSTRSSAFVLAMFTAFGWQQIVHGQEAAQGSARAFATSVLEIYRSKDVSKLLSMLHPSPPESVIPRIVPGTPPYEQLFGRESPQWQAVQAWDFKLRRIALDEEAYIVVHKRPSAFGAGNPDVLDCVRLKRRNGVWLFDKFYVAQQAQVNGPEFTEWQADSKPYGELNRTTAAILAAYRKKDAEQVKALSVEEGPSALRGQSEKSEDERLFESLDMRTVSAWEGRPGRVFTRDAALVSFGESEDSTHSLHLLKVEGEWKLKDIKIESK